MVPEGRVTRLLSGLRQGDPAALDALFGLLYEELRSLAHRQLRGARGTLGTTAVVHEAYLKLIGSDASAQDRAHFFALAARVMRQILVDHARARRALKRGGEAAHIPLEDAHVASGGEASAEALLELEAALGALQAVDERLVRMVELRFFVGLEVEETAEILGLTARTLRRDWRKARAFLHAALESPSAADAV